MINLGEETCFLIVTHSGNLDVLKGLETNFTKHGFRIYNGFVLFNDNINRSPIEGFNPLIVKQGDWISEIRQGLNNLKNRGYSRIVLWLDDFYLTRPVDELEFKRHIENSDSYPYLGLKRQRNSFLLKRDCLNGVCKFNEKFKYYSSLQVAVWDIDHFLNILAKSCNIWDFELQKIKNYYHYEVENSCVSYLHAVEKGRWKYYTKIFFYQEFNSSKEIKTTREFESSFLRFLAIDVLRIFKVRLLGY